MFLYTEPPEMTTLLIVVSFWIFQVVLGLMLLIIAVKGIAFWEKSHNRQVNNAYLAGIMFLLLSLVPTIILLIRRKERVIHMWNFTDWTHYSWFMPIIWYYFAILTCTCLGLRYIQVNLVSIIRDSKSSFERRIEHKFLRRKSTIWDLLGTLMFLCAILFLAFFISQMQRSAAFEYILLVVLLGVSVLLLIKISTWVIKGDSNNIQELSE
ncbi:MAG: hypothetical protein ACFFDT_22315 [Candidatus Hodarchaeota archaeon]